MYQEHLLSINHVQKLLYHQVQSDSSDCRTLHAPPFFLAQGNQSSAGKFFPPGGSKAKWHISFFAQSLTTVMPQPLPVDAMPMFTVITPHYLGKVILSLHEIICKQDQNSHVTLLRSLACQPRIHMHSGPTRRWIACPSQLLVCRNTSFQRTLVFLVIWLPERNRPLVPWLPTTLLGLGANYTMDIWISWMPPSWVCMVVSPRCKRGCISTKISLQVWMPLVMVARSSIQNIINAVKVMILGLVLSWISKQRSVLVWGSRC